MIRKLTAGITKKIDRGKISKKMNLVISAPSPLHPNKQHEDDASSVPAQAHESDAV